MLEDVRCVAFDIDDTLYLERDYVKSGFSAVGVWIAENLGFERFAEKAWQSFLEGARGDVFNRVLAEGGIEATDELIGRLVAVYRSHQPNIELLADAQACLAEIASSRCTAAVSDGPLESQRAKAIALGLDRQLDHVLLTAELGPQAGKPSTQAFEIVEQRTGCRRSECVYVADNPHKDFLGPAALGWHTVRIRRPEGLHRDAPSGPEVEQEMTDLKQFTAALTSGQ